LKGSDTVFFLTVSAEAINVVYLNNAWFSVFLARYICLQQPEQSYLIHKHKNDQYAMLQVLYVYVIFQLNYGIVLILIDYREK
jgi:hypothetical protein